MRACADCGLRASCGCVYEKVGTELVCKPCAAKRRKLKTGVVEEVGGDILAEIKAQRELQGA